MKNDLLVVIFENLLKSETLLEIATTANINGMFTELPETYVSRS